MKTFRGPLRAAKIFAGGLIFIALLFNPVQNVILADMSCCTHMVKGKLSGAASSPEIVKPCDVHLTPPSPKENTVCPLN